MPTASEPIEAAKPLLDAYCERKIPAQVRHKLKLDYRIQGKAVTLFETRPRFNRPEEWIEVPFARFRYVASRKLWNLYWRDSHGRWHLHEEAPSFGTFELALQYVDRDPTHIFWG